MAKEIIKEKNLQMALHATFQLFLRVGIEKATREMLIKDCGLSRATISRYFQNKTDWVMQTAEYIGSHVEKERPFDMSILEDESISGIEALSQYLSIGSELWQEDSRLFALWGEFKTYIYRHHDNISDANKKLDSDIGHIVLVKRIIEKGLKDGSISSEYDAQKTADFICKVYYGLLISLALDTYIEKEYALRNIRYFKDGLLKKISQ